MHEYAAAANAACTCCMPPVHEHAAAAARILRWSDDVSESRTVRQTRRKTYRHVRQAGFPDAAWGELPHEYISIA